MAEQSVPDSAVKAAAEVMLRQYDEEYDASYLSWNDFADVAREVLEAAAPILVAAGRAQAAADIRDDPYPNPSPAIPAWHAGYVEATERAAVVAEGSTP